MDLNLKSFINKAIPGSLKGVISGICNKRSNPYSIKSSFINPGNISDFFVWNPHVAKTDFIAENIRALFLGRGEEIVHCFKFFSHKGILLSEEKYKSDDFFCRITLSGPPKSLNYSSFIHYVESRKRFHDLEKNHFKNNNFFCEQNRGYCIYYPNKKSSVGSAVHGNFGGISKEGKSLLARQRSFHLYTPAYRFESQNCYDLVFNNPSPSKINVGIVFNNKSDQPHIIHINSLGTQSFRLENYSGSLTFRSRLPICRPVLFKNIHDMKSGNFDVLHS